tara:strand:+ start:3661 stop:4506 length:846 start_codon:yes stop_codon:yes gene_type:complete
MFKPCFLIILFILLLLILVKKNNKFQIEKFTNNTDFIISMFITGGLCKEAENLIITLKKLNLDSKLIVTCLDSEAENCIKKLGVKTRVKKNLKLARSATFSTKDFYNITYQKLVIIQELLEETKKVVLFTDSDIVFLKDPTIDIKNFINSNYDILFQDESRKFGSNKKSICTGFMVFKPTKQSINLLQESKKFMKNEMNNRQFDGGKSADQYAVQVSVKKIKNLKYSYFDSKNYPNGARYFNNINSIYRSYIPIIIHNNFIKGLENKIKRFKKHGFWYVKE